jgi:hypothetical protein
MSQVTISDQEYKQLKRQGAAYRKIAAKLFQSVVKDDVASVVRDFADTKLYSKGFLKDLEKGLQKSSYGSA